MARAMNELEVGNGTEGTTPHRWGALQRALIYQWQAAAWLVLFVGVLAMVVGMSPHHLLSIALVLGSIVAGPFVIASFAKRLRLYAPAEIFCWFGAAVALLPAAFVFAVILSEVGTLLGMVQALGFSAMFAIPAGFVSRSLLGMGEALQHVPENRPALNPREGSLE
jgi:hypothetical protein